MLQTHAKKIVLTGGHAATAAISVVEELLRRSGKTPLEIYWIGAKRAIEGKDIATIESQALPKLGVSTHLISAGRLQRKFNIWTVPSLAKIPAGFVSATNLIRKIKPDIILSFGGFAAFPVVFVGWVMGIPVILHEQTSSAGRANKFSSPFAKKIAVARVESLKHFPSNKVVVTGNPIMTQIAEISPKTKLASPSTIFVTGGSRGACTINNLVKPLLPKLLEKYIVIHQTGELDFEQFTKIKKSLPNALKENYEVYSQIDPMQIDGVFKRADVLVGRSGANTVSEIMAIHLPSIFIPIPFAYEDEQTKNAEFARGVGLAEVIPQKKATPQALWGLIEKTIKNWNSKVAKAARFESPDKKASSRLVDLVLGQLHI